MNARLKSALLLPAILWAASVSAVTPEATSKAPVTRAPMVSEFATPAWLSIEVIDEGQGSPNYSEILAETLVDAGTSKPSSGDLASCQQAASSAWDCKYSGSWSAWRVIPKDASVLLATTVNVKPYNKPWQSVIISELFDVNKDHPSSVAKTLVDDLVFHITLSKDK